MAGIIIEVGIAQNIEFVHKTKKQIQNFNNNKQRKQFFFSSKNSRYFWCGTKLAKPTLN